MIRIMVGDCREVMKTLADASVDSIVTDPPYELTSKRPGGRSEATRGAVMGGFMGMKWDGTGVAFDVETWRECLRVLKPGGFLIAFGGTRTYHRLACAIEDGGFDVRDMLAWLYGSGFPKGTDKAKIPAAWNGWNTALKPALEPACLARKPMEGTLAENLLKWGTGALWIDGCRIALDENEEIETTGAGGIPLRHSVDAPRVGNGAPDRDPRLPRWPANVLHDGSEEVLAIFPQSAGQLADSSSSSSSRKTQYVYGNMKRGNGREGEPSAGSANEGGVGFKMKPGVRRGDAGSAARFFYCAKADKVDRNDGLYDLPDRLFGMSGGAAAAAARGEHYDNGDSGMNRTKVVKNNHPTVKPTDVMRWLCKMVTPPSGLLLDPFMGSGSTLKAAELEGFSAIGIELDADYAEIARRRIASDAPLFAQVSTELQPDGLAIVDIEAKAP